MNKLLSPSPLWPDSGLAFIRIVVGGFMIFHGWEIFDEAKMKEYLVWDSFKRFSSPAFMVYMGKATELVAGIFLTIGLFTRLASVVLILTMAYIAFFVGNGEVWYKDQHPFLFVLLGLVFFFAGPGRMSADQFFFKRKRSY